MVEPGTALLLLLFVPKDQLAKAHVAEADQKAHVSIYSEKCHGYINQKYMVLASSAQSLLVVIKADAEDLEHTVCGKAPFTGLR